jgi:hypothetical protein
MLETFVLWLPPIVIVLLAGTLISLPRWLKIGLVGLFLAGIVGTAPRDVQLGVVLVILVVILTFAAHMLAGLVALALMAIVALVLPGWMHEAMWGTFLVAMAITFVEWTAGRVRTGLKRKT